MDVQRKTGVAVAPDGAAAPIPLIPTTVAVAASAGGVQALRYLMAELPAGLPAAVIVLLHLSPDHVSMLPAILARDCLLSVKPAQSGDCLCAAHVYVAPPDRHVSVNADGTLSLLESARVHHVRPSADVLFESLGRALGARAVAVVLTGHGADGTPGAAAVRRAGGTVIAQDRGSSEHFGMPGAAIAAGAVDLVLPLDEIPAALVRLATTGVAG